MKMIVAAVTAILLVMLSFVLWGEVHYEQERTGKVTEKWYSHDAGDECYYIEIENDTIFEVDSRTYHEAEIGEETTFKTVPGEDREWKEVCIAWLATGASGAAVVVACWFACEPDPDAIDLKAEIQKIVEERKARGG